MKLTDDDLLFYFQFSPPKPGEKLQGYCQRRFDAWNEALVGHDEDDKRRFRSLADELHDFEVKPGKQEKAPQAEEPKKPKVSKKTQELLAKRALEIEALRKKKVNYSATFDKHLFEGEDDGKAHKGLHSMARLLKTKGSAAAEVIEKDAAFDTYSAWVKLKGKSERKASSFFPDDWKEDRVRAVIQEAYLDSRVNPGNSNSLVRLYKNVHWVGRVNIDGKELLVAGLGDGDKASGIATAFPAVNGGFTDHNG